MLAYVVKTDGNAPAFVEIQDELQTYYDLIGCDLIDITPRRVNGADYEIVCDDEGLLKSEPIITAVSSEGRPQLVGGLVVLLNGGDGELAGLKSEDVLRLTNATQYSIQQNKLQAVLVLDD